MAYKKYEAGMRRTELKILLRKRLSVKDKIRHHKGKIELYETALLALENDIDSLLVFSGKC